MVSKICWFWPQFTVVVCCGCGCCCCCGCGCGCGCRRRRFKTVQLSEILNKPRWSFREWPPSLQYFTAGCCPNICCNSNCTWMTTTLLVFPQEDVYMRYLCISVFLVTAPLGRPLPCFFEGSQTWSDCERWKNTAFYSKCDRHPWEGQQGQPGVKNTTVESFEGWKEKEKARKQEETMMNNKSPGLRWVL